MDQRPYDRTWLLGAYRGEIDTDPALDAVRTARWAPDVVDSDPALAEALAEGDRLHPNDPRRWPDGWPTCRAPWELDIDTDPEAAAAFDALVAGNGHQPHEPPDRYFDPDLFEFVDGDEPAYDWSIEGLVERGDRVIVTGPEGGGKSTLLRQIAVQASGGIHPFTLEPIDPLQVLFVDCENSVRQARRKFRELAPLVDPEHIAGRLRIRVLGHAIELARDEIRLDLAARINVQYVDLLIIGPLYKLIGGDPIREQDAKAVADALDYLRGIRGSALLIEAHSPYAEGARTKRPIRPYGASLWSRWPEFGIYLDPDGGSLQHWRGARDERSWPRRLQHGTPWPWVPGPERPDEQEQWHGPTECAAAIVTLLTETGEEMTANELARQLRERGRGYKDSTVRDAAAFAVADGRLTSRTGPRRSHLYAAGQPVDNPSGQGEWNLDEPF